MSEVSATESVAVVGLGAMGGPIASRLAAAHQQFLCYDANPEARSKFRDAGLQVADDIEAIAEHATVVVTMLPSPAVFRSSMVDEGSLGRSLAEGTLVINMATDGPTVMHEVAKALEPNGVRLVDSPVGRGPKAAAAGELLLLMGGDPADVDRAVDVLDPVAAKVYRCGSLGSGQTVKLANNLVQSTNIAVLSEALSLAVEAGVSPDLLAEVMSCTAANSFQVNNGLIGKALKGDFSPIFRLDLAMKDVRLATELADTLGVETKAALAALDRFRAASEAGFGDYDQTALFRMVDPSLEQRSES